MIAWFLATVGVGVAPPPVAAEPPEQPDQWYCAREIVGPRHAKVSVQIYVEADGHVVGRGAFWTPARADGQADALRYHGAAPELSIQYDVPARGETGRPLGIASDVTPDPGARRLRGASVSLSLDTGGTWSAPLVAWPYMGKSFTSYNADLSDADPQGEGARDLILEEVLERAHTADLALVGKDKRRLSVMRYDVGDHALRDQLFRKAWAAAELAAQTPLKSCDRTVKG